MERDRRYYPGEPDLHRLNHAHDITEKEPARALQEFRLLAEQGSLMSMVYIGWAYGRGEGVEKDLSQAKAWIKRAADLGSPVAQYLLGQLYAKLGETDKAGDLFRLAAEKDYAPALYMLGLLHFTGKGAAKDIAQCIALMERAVALGNPQAKTFLAHHLLTNQPDFRSFWRGMWLGLSARLEFFYIRLTEGPRSERLRQ
jgi:TPR repeat protein